MRLLVFSFHVELNKGAPMLIAWPWESRRQVTIAGISAELERKLEPRDEDAERAPRLHAENIIRALGEARIDDASIERAISSLERQTAPLSEPERILRPRNPEWLAVEHYHAGATFAFQIVEVRS